MKNVISKIMFYSFYILIIAIVIYIGSYIITPLAYTMYFNNDKDIVEDENLYNELAQVIKNYTNDIIYGNYINANNTATYNTKKSNKKYSEIAKEIDSMKEGNIFIKRIYKITDDVYKCYFFKNNKRNLFHMINDTNIEEDLAHITIRLNDKTATYEIISSFN